MVFTFYSDGAAKNYGEQIEYFMGKHPEFWTKKSPRMLVDLSNNASYSRIKRYIDGSSSLTAKGELNMTLSQKAFSAYGISTVIVSPDNTYSYRCLTLEKSFASRNLVSAIDSLPGCRDAEYDKGVFFVKISAPRFGQASFVHVLKGSAEEVSDFVLKKVAATRMTWIVQPSIGPPALFGGRKWDVRSYAVILGDADRVVGFAFDQAFARVSSQPFKKFDDSSGAASGYITNSSLSKKIGDGDYDPSKLKIQVPHKIVKDILIPIARETVKSAADFFDQRGSTGYIILGFDTIFMPSGDIPVEADPSKEKDYAGLSPRLIEVNDFPAQYIDDAGSGHITKTIWKAMATVFLPALAKSNNLSDGTRVSDPLRFLANASDSVISELTEGHFVKILSTKPRHTVPETAEQKKQYLAETKIRAKVFKEKIGNAY
jgi:hypothetical protein